MPPTHYFEANPRHLISVCLFISCMFMTLACCCGLVSVKCRRRFRISSALLPCGQHCFFLSGPSAALSASPHPQSEPQAQQAPSGAPAALLLTTPLHQPSMRGSPGRKQDGPKTSQEKPSRAHDPTALFINEGSEGPEKPRASPGSHSSQLSRCPIRVSVQGVGQRSVAQMSCSSHHVMGAQGLVIRPS